MADNNKVVIIGANGTMGAGAGCVFAGAGYNVTMLARSARQGAEGLVDAQNDARAEAIARANLARYVRRRPRARGRRGRDRFRVAGRGPAAEEGILRAGRQAAGVPDSIVATGSSGLSIAEMARGRSESFRRNFLGIHLFNPPHVIVGTEVIPGPETDPAVVKNVVAMLTNRLGRKVIVTQDHARVRRQSRRLQGPQRDCAARRRARRRVHRLSDRAAYRARDAAAGHRRSGRLGRAQGDRRQRVRQHQGRGARLLRAAGVHEARRSRKDASATRRRSTAASTGARARTFSVLDPKTGGYDTLQKPAPIEFVEKMKQLHRVGRYAEAFEGVRRGHRRRRRPVPARRPRLRQLRARTASARWRRAPPTSTRSCGSASTGRRRRAIVDLIGAKKTVAMLEKLKLPVPQVVEQAASRDAKMFAGGVLEYGRTLRRMNRSSDYVRIE